MLQLHAGPFLDAVNRINRMAQLLNWVRGENRAFISMPRNAFVEFSAHAKAFSETCLELSLSLTYLSTKQLVKVCEDIGMLAKSDNIYLDQAAMLAIQARVDDISGRIKAEIDSRLLFVLPSKNLLYYEQVNPLFGLEFESKFPSVQFDLASVFHFMRIVEAGLGAVHSCLGIPNSLSGNDRSWGSALNRIKQNVETRGNKWTEKEIFQEILMLLNATKDA